jgi:hypothetical protein
MLRLQSGLTVEDPMSIVLGYVNANVYSRYDAVPVLHDNQLRQSEIELSRRLGSRISNRQVAMLCEQRDPVEAALADIPGYIDLLDVPFGEPIPGEAGISGAITAMCRIDGIKLAKSAKILHKKRPALIPILDTVVQMYYWPKWVPSVRGRSWGDYATTMIRMIHRDLYSIGEQLREIRHGLTNRGLIVSCCRILDILIWVERTENANWFRQQA